MAEIALQPNLTAEGLVVSGVLPFGGGHFAND